jgi:hypothetical protein
MCNDENLMLLDTFTDMYMKLNKYIFQFILRRNKSYVFIRSVIKKRKGTKNSKAIFQMKKERGSERRKYLP